MWQRIRNTGWVALVCVGAVSAQQPEYVPPASAAVQAGASNDQAPVNPMSSIPSVPASGEVVAQTTPVAVERPVSEVDPDVAALRNLQKDVAVTQAEVGLLTAQVQAQDARKQLQPFTKGTAGLPKLIGVFGVGTELTAQFSVGMTVSEVRAGEWLTSDWRVVRITGLGVELTDKQGRTHTALFGGEPERNTAPAMLQQQPTMQPQFRTQR